MVDIPIPTDGDIELAKVTVTDLCRANFDPPGRTRPPVASHRDVVT